MAGAAAVQLDQAALEAGLDHVRQAPRGRGTLELICRRPADAARELVDEALLDERGGLIGDNWLERGSSSTSDGAANPLAQLTLMNIRSAQLIAATPGRVPLMGDQLFVDFDLSGARLPAGSRVQVGEAVVQITELPHRGCGKFSRRFGVEALKFVNSADGRELNLRGVNARVVEGGRIRRGDAVELL